MGTIALRTRTDLAGGWPGRAALLIAGLALAAVAEGTRLRAGWPVSWVLVDMIPGLCLLAAGAVAWQRRPDTRMGLAMMLAGIAWYSGTLTSTLNASVDRLGYAFQGYYDPILAWLALAYPTGKLAGLGARVVVGSLFGVLVARSMFRLLTFRTSTDFDFGVASEVERYVADMTLRDTGDAIFRVLIAGLMAVVLLLLIRRIVRESTLARRLAWPMLIAGVAIAAGVVVKLGALAVASNVEQRFDAWALGDIVTATSGTGIALAFVVGLVRGRLARQAVADLVLELETGGGRPALRDTVAKALRDPSVELLYPGPDGAYLDAAGQLRRLPETADRATTRIEAGGQTLAVLVHDPAIGEQPELTRSVIAAVRLAIENERLAAEVRAQLAEVQASRARIVAAGDAERRRIERDLHDGAQQRLVTLALRLQMARSAADLASPEATEMLDGATRELEGAISELRELARGLHPSALETDGLRGAITALAERTPIPVTLDVTDQRFDLDVETAAYYVVAEAFTNIARSAQASLASVRVQAGDGVLHVEVVDDGVGGADPSRGSGLRGLQDRVAALGGSLTVESPPGAGTAIRAELPCG